MSRPSFRIVVAMLVVLFAAAPHIFAQGGGASSTGSINGKVIDSSGAVLPGATVTATSPSLMGTQTSVTDAGGFYRYPALPPGAYTLTYELPGFNKLKRENIQISLGFTATVNVELTVASLQETVTVTGESPVIDTSTTRVQQNFKLEALQEMPNARDLWSLLAVTPGVSMSRIDVGGNRAGTQTGYTAYGYSGQNRVLVEGINTTEGTSSAGFYVDYGSFEEVFLGTIGQGAEMPTPGVQSQMLGKSGGNKFQGEIYQDYERNGFQTDNIASNLPIKFAYDPVKNSNGVRDHSNEIQLYRDFNLNVGGPVKKDKLWWYFSYRNQKTSVGQPNYIGAAAGNPFDTLLWNPSGKATYQINQNNKLIGYYQWGEKKQPNRLPDSAFLYDSLGETLSQISGSWIYKGEWNGTLGRNLYAEARYGVFGYYFPLLANTTTTLPQMIDTGFSTYKNGDELEQTDRQRRQVSGALTYFKDGWGGTHNFKVGGEYLLETGWYGLTQRASGNIRENFNKGAPVNVILYAPTATHVGKLGDGPNGNLLSVDKLTTLDAFLNDQYSVGRATFNLGVRFDHYRAWTPVQTQLPYSFGPLNVQAMTFPEQTYATFNAFAPRVGLSYDLRGDGKTVLKVNYGLYRFNPGVGVAANANPNQATKSVTYQWTDSKPCPGCIAGDGIYQPGEEGNLTSSALAGAVTVDPNLKQPYSNQTTVAVERQLIEDLGARVGFVLYKVYNQINQYQPLRPVSAYTVPFTYLDTSANQSVALFGIPNSAVSGCSPTVTAPTPNCLYPTNQVTTNAPDNGTYKTVEFALNKRMSHKWSAVFGAGYTWQHDFPLGSPNTPNGPFDYDYSGYSVKGSGSYSAPWGILLTGVYRFQAGPNYARRLSIPSSATTASGCACTFSAARAGSLSNAVIFETPYNAFRQDNISVLDLRVEKTLNLVGSAKVRLFFDGFNVLNKYAAETITVNSGTAFQQPTAILGPRTGRVGFRFMW